MDKKHMHVMRDIKKLIEQGAINQSKVGLVDYKDAKGESRPMYLLDFNATMILITRYDAKRRAAVVNRWTELEKLLKPLGMRTPERQSEFFFGGNETVLPLDQQTIIIPERDVYRLIMRSKLPNAEQFEEWVVGEVLPSFLEVKKDFSNWIKKQIERARLLENRDYIVFAQKGENLNDKSGRPSIEYFLTLEAGKHIAMLSGTEKGFEVREYFLECEKVARQEPAYTLSPNTALVFSVGFTRLTFVNHSMNLFIGMLKSVAWFT